MQMILRSDRLAVEVVKPGIYPNTTFRFDRAGFIQQVTLDKVHHFCTREPDNLSHPSSGGVGLCNEFLFEEPSIEALVGQKFPKPGIGLLTKHEDAPYVFFHNYDCDPYDIDVEITEDHAAFVTRAKQCMGYAAEHRKNLHVFENTLTMETTVTNTGERTLNFSEYCHNFLTLDRLPIGPKYHLQMDIVDISGRASDKGDSLCADKNVISFSKYSDTASMYFLKNKDILPGECFSWKLSHDDSPLSVRGDVSARPNEINIWAVDHIISPEIICSFSIAPGKSCTWKRKWTFDNK